MCSKRVTRTQHISPTYQHFMFITSLSCSDARVRVSGFGLMIPLSRSLVGKARGCDIDFLRCSFRPLIPVTISRGRNAISENRVTPRLFRALHQVRTVFRSHSHHKSLRHLTSICSGGAGWRDLRLMERWRKRGNGPCFEHFVSERRQT